MSEAPDRAAVAACIMELVRARGEGRTICPSEVARRLADDWRALMPQVRTVAAALAADGDIAVTQGGRAVDAATARGPIRLRLARSRRE